MKKILYSALTLILGLVLSSSGCNTMDAVDPDGIKIGDLIWAKYNVGAPGTFASTPESPGMFYKWNINIGWSASDPIQSFPSLATWSSTYSTATKWEAGNNPCPDGWRVHTQSDFGKLLTASQGWDAVKKGREYGSGTNTIFLPAAGSRSSALGNVGTNGYYWMSDAYNDSYACVFLFVNNVQNISNQLKYLGNTIRCVK